MTDQINMICGCCQRLANLHGTDLCGDCFEQHIMEVEASDGREPGGVALRMAEVAAATEHFEAVR